MAPPAQQLSAAVQPSKKGVEISAAAEDKNKAASNEFWVFPSLQIFCDSVLGKYYSRRRKGVEHTVDFSHTNNETAWREVLKWEALHSDECDKNVQQPLLKRCTGMARVYSPRARVLSWLGCRLPFDRRDWIVERKDGKEVRYVVDYYTCDKVSKDQEKSTILSVRPALDSFEAVKDRSEMAVRKVTSVLQSDNTFADEIMRAAVLKYSSSVFQSDAFKDKFKATVQKWTNFIRSDDIISSSSKDPHNSQRSSKTSSRFVVRSLSDVEREVEANNSVSWEIWDN